jgi:integrase
MTDLVVITPPALVATDSNRVWQLGYEAWMATLKPNTARAYKAAWVDLLSRYHIFPWDLSRADVAEWAEDMGKDGLSASTRRQRLAAVSAFFRFMADDYGQVTIDNPASSRAIRPDREDYHGARFLDAADVKKLLASIDRSTLYGARDYALILFYIFTGRRNSEVRKLTWGDIETHGRKIFYTWSGKGKSRRDEIPHPVWAALQDYTFKAGWMAPDSKAFLFPPLSDSSARLPNVCAQTWTRDRAISAREVERILARLIKHSGLKYSIRVHDLRHTAAMLRRAAGDDVEQVSDFLNHSSLTVTQVYLHGLEGREDKSWQAVQDLLGIGG